MVTNFIWNISYALCCIKDFTKKGTRTRLNNDKISSLDYFLSLDEEGLDNSEN